MKRLLTAVIALAVVVVGFSLYTKTASAATVTLSGYAWSENVGWIKFKNASPAYGVTVDSVTGVFSGYAWSENMGWISFNSSDLSGCPSGTCNASMNLLNGSLSGWAKVLSTGGWIHLSGSGYGVSYNSSNSQFSGYAWSDTYIGWIHFAGSGYGVITDASLAPPDATINVTASPTSATWTINPGSLAGTGNGSKTVTPSYSGTVYTITPGTPPSGYDAGTCTWNTGTASGSGCQMTLFGGEISSFALTYPVSFNYSLSNGGSMNVTKGGGSYVAPGQTTVTKTLLTGTSQAVDLSVSGLPSGVTLQSISGNPMAPTSNSTVTLNVSSSASVGTFPITVTGTPLSKTTVFNLIISSSPDIFVSCTRTGTPQVGQTITWTADISQTPSQSPYTFYWTGTNLPTSPAPNTQSFNIAYSTTGTKTVDVLVTDSKGNTGTCNPDGSVNIGVNPTFQEF
ncbi:hypothetical protein KW796_02965 [Candidatus Parcubacteria bacterium]|nr:hypothetical protein [Candidatus Parcubacteria bacterium]